MCSGAAARQWNPDPFGNGGPLGAFSYELRFPGQFFDQATRLHYNYFRDYDPRLGRYIESDPIGLAGGINTYAYAGGNPLIFTDPYGLWRLPDYIGGNLNIAIPNPWTGSLFGWSGTINVDRYGDIFWSPLGAGVGKAVSGSLTANWLDCNGTPSQAQLSNFLSANGFSSAAGFVGGVTQSYTPGTPGAGWATGVGLVSPQFGVSYNYSFSVGNIGFGW